MLRAARDEGLTVEQGLAGAGDNSASEGNMSIASRDPIGLSQLWCNSRYTPADRKQQSSDDWWIIVREGVRMVVVPVQHVALRKEEVSSAHSFLNL